MSRPSAPTHDADLAMPDRELVENAARFSQIFGRWMARSSTGTLTYPRLRVLESLFCNGPARMCDLADEMGLSARNLTTIADALESDDLVVRTPHPTDRRVTLLEITPAGREIVTEALAPTLREMARLFEVLEPDQQEMLGTVLAKLTTAIDESDRG